MKQARQLLVAAVAAFAVTGAHAQATEEIKVSYQPALYWRCRSTLPPRRTGGASWV